MGASNLSAVTPWRTPPPAHAPHPLTPRAQQPGTQGLKSIAQVTQLGRAGLPSNLALAPFRKSFTFQLPKHTPPAESRARCTPRARVVSLGSESCSDQARTRRCPCRGGHRSHPQRAKFLPGCSCLSLSALLEKASGVGLPSAHRADCPGTRLHQPCAADHTLEPGGPYGTSHPTLD